MPGGTRESGPGRLQCNLCWKWFRPAGLGGHKRFYHGLWKDKLRGDILDLTQQLQARKRLPEEFSSLIGYGFGYLDEGQLLFWKERLQAVLARLELDA